MARKHNQPGGRHIEGTLPSLKQTGEAKYRPVHFEAPLELEQALLLEFDPTVVVYFDHPFPIVGQFPDGTRHPYTPDFQVLYAGKKALIECKPEVLLEDDTTRLHKEIGEAWASANDHEFHLVTDKDLHTVRLENVKLLWRYRLAQVPLATLLCCDEYLTEHAGGIALGELAGHLASQETTTLAPIFSLYSLLFHNHLESNFEQPLTPTSVVWRSGAREERPCREHL